MAIRFPFEKRRAVDKDGQPLVVADETLPETAPPPAYPTIDPNQAPPATVEEPATAAVAPDIDPAVLSAVRERQVNPPPMVSPTGQVMDENASRPRLVETNSKGHPTLNPTIADPVEARSRLKDRVDAYEPQAEPKWRHYGRLAGLIGSIFAGAVGHDSKAVANATYAAAKNFDPKYADQEWQKRKQAEVNQQVEGDLNKRKTEATITNLEAQPELRERAYRQRQQGLDTAGRRVSDARMKAALDMYHKNDYAPGENKSLDKYFEDSGLHDLPARKAADKWEYKLIDGDLIKVPKSGTGGAENVTFTPESGGGLVTDPGKAATESVTIGGQTFDHLTPSEAARLEGRAYEGEQGRKSREGIAANAQAGATARAGMTGGVKPGAINSSVKGAIAAISKFRALTAKIQSQKLYYGTTSSPAADDHPAIRALFDQRDGLERDIKQLYGSFITLDDKGKPFGIKDEALTTPGSSSAGRTIEGAIQAFKSSKKRAPTKDEIARMQAAIDAAR